VVKALPESVDETLALLSAGDYVARRSLATALYLTFKLRRPLFLEGEAGVGKTELAKVVAQALDRDLIRLQCYEGLDIAAAVYEWNYPRQMLAIRMADGAGESEREALLDDIYGSGYLIQRPILRALEPHASGPPVLLIDELDRADEPFEAFLLEVLADFQVTIPELGPVKAQEPPIVMITSNRTREIHDALKRRCYYAWLDYPDRETELAIVRLKVPGVAEQLSSQLVDFVQALRRQDLFKSPGIAETIDWARALVALQAEAVDQTMAGDTLGALLKYQDDLEKVRANLTQLLPQ
jgi:MoxR-like ATPase